MSRPPAPSLRIGASPCHASPLPLPSSLRRPLAFHCLLAPRRDPSSSRPRLHQKLRGQRWLFCVSALDLLVGLTASSSLLSVARPPPVFCTSYTCPVSPGTVAHPVTGLVLGEGRSWARGAAATVGSSAATRTWRRRILGVTTTSAGASAGACRWRRTRADFVHPQGSCSATTLQTAVHRVSSTSTRDTGVVGVVARAKLRDHN